MESKIDVVCYGSRTWAIELRVGELRLVDEMNYTREEDAEKAAWRLRERLGLGTVDLGPDPEVLKHRGGDSADPVDLGGKSGGGG